MDGRGDTTRFELPDEEYVILSTIVDAMLNAQTDLENATAQQWKRILVRSCRQQKRGRGPAGQTALLAT